MATHRRDVPDDLFSDLPHEYSAFQVKYGIRKIDILWCTLVTIVIFAGEFFAMGALGVGGGGGGSRDSGPTVSSTQTAAPSAESSTSDAPSDGSTPPYSYTVTDLSVKDGRLTASVEVKNKGTETLNFSSENLVAILTTGAKIHCNEDLTRELPNGLTTVSIPGGESARGEVVYLINNPELVKDFTVTDGPDA